MYVQCMLKLILIKINVSTMPLKETHTAFMLTILEYLVMACPRGCSLLLSALPTMDRKSPVEQMVSEI